MDPMADKEMLDRARALHPTKISTPSSLKTICFDFFIWKENKSGVSSWSSANEEKDKKTKKNIFAHFSIDLKNDVLDYLLSKEQKKCGNHVRNFLSLIHMLLNPNTVKLDFCNTGDDILWCGSSYGDLRKMFEEVAEKAPKLEYFALDEYAEDMHGNVIVYPLMTSLIKLKDLTHLSLRGGWMWDNDDLSTLFQNLSNLVFLKLLIHKSVKAKGFEDLHLLTHLEAFHFTVTCEELDDKRKRWGVDIFPKFNWIYKWLAQNAPQLKSIGGTIEDAFSGRLGELQRVEPKFKKTKGISKLECLHSCHELPAANFPNLRQLLFQNPNDNFNFVQKISSFTNLRELILGSVETEAIKEILLNIGSQLSQLTLKEVKDKVMDYFCVLHFCPNLVKLSQCCGYRVSGEEMGSSKYQALVNKHHFRLLEIFHHNGPARQLQEGLLELLLQAPLIEQLTVEPIELNKAHCEIFRDVPEGQFSKLRKLHLNDVTLGEGCTPEDVNMLVKHLVSNLANFNSLEIIYKDKSLAPAERPWKWEANSDPTDMFNFWALLDHSKYCTRW